MRPDTRHDHEALLRRTIKDYDDLAQFRKVGKEAMVERIEREYDIRILVTRFFEWRASVILPLPYVFVNTGLFRGLTVDALEFLLLHEIGHLRYSRAANFMGYTAGFITLVFRWLLFSALQVAAIPLHVFDAMMLRMSFFSGLKENVIMADVTEQNKADNYARLEMQKKHGGEVAERAELEVWRYLRRTGVI